MNIREINENEADSLHKLIAELSEYHNEISENFKGIYPKNNYGETLEKFKKQIASGYSRIAVIGDDEIYGFCKIDINGTNRKLDYLVVTSEKRGRGYGGELMDWAMKSFHEAGVSAVEVKAVCGNPAIHLYEKYGFRTESYILRINL